MGILADCIGRMFKPRSKNKSKDKRTQQQSHQKLQSNQQNSYVTQNVTIKDSTIIIQPNNLNAFEPVRNKHLIVDDVESNRYIIKKYLENIGIKTEEAANGKQALDKSIDQFDVLWIDLRMPIMDGFEFAKKIRESASKHKSLLVAVTGDVAQDSIRKCYDVGFDVVMMKPIISKELYDMQFIKKYKDQSKIKSELSQK